MINKKRILAGIIAVVMMLFLMPTATYAAGEGEVTYPLTIKVYDPASATTKDKTFNTADDMLGHLHGRSNWSYRTFREVFLGWSPDSKFADPVAVKSMSYNDRIYRDVESISTLLNDIDNVDENTVLYPVVVSVYDLPTMVTGLMSGSGSFSININQADEDIFAESDLIKESAGQGDLTATERKVVSYYDSGVEQYGVSSVSEFYYDDPRVPFLVIENPLAIIQSAKGITDFSGLTPTGYTFEDLHVKLDPNASTSKQQTNWTFSSSTFMVAAVLDKNGNELTSTIAQPTANSLVSTFSFENPNEEKEFIIRTIPRNDNSDSAYEKNTYPSNNTATASGADVMKPMILNSGDWTNITIPKDVAKKTATDDGLIECSFGGAVSGGVKIDKKNMTGGALPLAFLLPNFQAVGLIETQNNVVYDFVPAVAKFDKNSASLGDTEEQTIGYSVFAVNNAMDEDDFDTGTAPGPIDNKGDAFADTFIIGNEYTINGMQYIFDGWNSAADGQGADITADSPILTGMLMQADDADITIYAKWKLPEEIVENPGDDTPADDTPDDTVAPTTIRTGDMSNMDLWTVLLMASMVGIGAVISFTKKKNNN